MRTTAIMLIAMAMIFTACKKSEVIPTPETTDNSRPNYGILPKQEQYVLVLEFAASCPGVDAWVNAQLDSILSYAPVWPVPIICDECISGDSIAKRMSRLYPDSSIFIVNDQACNLPEQIPGAVDAVLTRVPEAQTNFTLKKIGHTITITSKTTFFKSVNGADYYLAFYALEDYIKRGNRIASHMLRASSLDNNVLGEKIVSGAAAAGNDINKSYSIECPQSCIMENMTVAAVIWKKVNGVLTFVNAFEKK